MDQMLALPVYRATVLDAIDAGASGWKRIALGLSELAVPLVVDEFGPGPARERYPVGSTLRFTLRCHAASIAPAADASRIMFAWDADFLRCQDANAGPLVPASGYELYGTVTGARRDDLLLDAGLTLAVTLPWGHYAQDYPPGTVVCVCTGRLEITRVEGDGLPEPPALIRRRECTPAAGGRPPAHGDEASGGARGGPVDEFRALFEYWRGAAEYWRREVNPDPERIRLGGFPLLPDWYRQTGQYDRLGRLHETSGTTKLMLLQAVRRPSTGVYLDAVGDLIRASHWFHRAGDLELARAAGRRALMELDRLFPDGVFRGEMSGDGTEEWFVREMMGDAAVWVDAALASAYYREAVRGFRAMEDHAHVAAWNELFSGRYMEDILRLFLSADPRDYVDGEKRVRFKLKQWLGADL